MNARLSKEDRKKERKKGGKKESHCHRRRLQRLSSRLSEEALKAIVLGKLLSPSPDSSVMMLYITEEPKLPPNHNHNGKEVLPMYEPGSVFLHMPFPALVRMIHICCLLS